jgi:hypothetical protein
VECDDGTEESVVLGTKQFKWLVCEPADEEKRKERFQEAVKNDAVGRKLKIFRSPDESGFTAQLSRLRKHPEKARFNLISHLQ